MTRVRAWKKIGDSRLLAKSHGRSLVIQNYLDQTGVLREYSHFRGNVFSCIILAITKENKVLAIRQYRPAVEEITLELPGGANKYDKQTPESVARQEFAEETSVYKPGKITPLLKRGCWFEPSGVNIIFYPYLFTECLKTEIVTQADDGEDVELVEIPLPEWIKMCETGQIRDSKSIAVTSLAKKYLKDKGI